MGKEKTHLCVRDSEIIFLHDAVFALCLTCGKFRVGKRSHDAGEWINWEKRWRKMLVYSKAK